MTDNELIRQVLAGETNAFSELVERYQSKVYSLALRMCGSEDDAFDLAQDAFVRAWQSLGSYRFDAAFSSWLFRLTSNICIDYLRKKKRSKVISLTFEDDEGEEVQLELPDPGPTPEQALLRAEERAMLAEAMNALPVEARQILTLRAIDALSYEQIAEVMGLPEGTVKSRLSRAREQLRKKLLQIGNKTKTNPSNTPKGGLRNDL